MPLFLFPVLLDFNTVLESSTRRRQQACLIMCGCSPLSLCGSPTWDDLAWAPLCALCWDADSSPAPFCFCSELNFWGKTRLSLGRARSADVLLRVLMSLPVRDAGLFSFRTGLLGFCWSRERTWGVAPPQLFSRACVGLPYSSLDVWCHCWSHLRLHILSGMVVYIFVTNPIYLPDRKEALSISCFLLSQFWWATFVKGFVHFICVVKFTGPKLSE